MSLLNFPLISQILHRAPTPPSGFGQSYQTPMQQQVGAPSAASRYFNAPVGAPPLAQQHFGQSYQTPMQIQQAARMQPRPMMNPQILNLGLGLLQAGQAHPVGTPAPSAVPFMGGFVR